MTTEHTNLQQSDVDKAVVEQQPVSETIPNLLSPEVIVPAEAQTDQHDQGQSQQQQNPTMNRGSTEVRDGSSPIYPGSTFSFTEAMPLVEADVARPFTDFIEEFRQAEEARLTSSLQEPTGEPFSVGEPPEFIVEADQRHQDEMAGQSVQASVSHEQAKEQAPDDTSAGTAVNTTGDTAGEQKPTLAESAAPVRPVSPLLRPASRLRLPRHGAAAGRQREEQPVTEKAQMVPAPETASSGEQPRPARRYRFDRPVASNAPIPLQSRSEEGKDTASRSLPLTPASARADSGSTPGKEVKEGNGQAKHSVTQSAEQEQTAAPVPPAATSEAEVVAPATVPPTTEVALEDLPPLEYSELQRASSRRRRRRRSGDTTSTVTATPTPTPVPATPTANAASTTKPAIPEPLATPGQTPAVTTPRSVTPLPGTAPTTVSQYNIVSGYTVSQMNQGNGGDGPFMSPEPSPARGSTPVRGNLRAVRAEAQRTTVYPVRTGDPALNQIANAVVQSIQAQTDRMVNELRRTNQVPANISVSLPQFPSTERVGVFVDVANLLYSARTLRITIDFAKLLDFLRGNRRLVRAQAYCPTSPHSSEDQMFLQAVKGLGYRITTKNYKTFSSGAKKADLDLDLCMDVVRLVDGKAVDSIVLVSGDSDFMPMLDHCSDHGVRVEVAAFDEAMSATLRQSCDLFINLAMLEEIRA